MLVREFVSGSSGYRWPKACDFQDVVVRIIVGLLAQAHPPSHPDFFIAILYFGPTAGRQTVSNAGSMAVLGATSEEFLLRLSAPLLFCFDDGGSVTFGTDSANIQEWVQRVADQSLRCCTVFTVEKLASHPTRINGTGLRQHLLSSRLTYT